MAPLSWRPRGLSRNSTADPDADGLEDDGGRAAAAAPEFEDDGGLAAAPDAPDADGLEDPAPGLSLGGMKYKYFYYI